MTDPVTRLNAALEGLYHVERQIGEGGMATVYLADDLKHERKVALKVLKPELAAVVGAERFLAEIKTTANLQHPHILPLFDSGEADGFLFYVMPFIDGVSLREKIDREKQLGVEGSVAIAEKVADALDYAHEHGVVHRDIKPANILVSERGEPLVADFGIALAVAQAGGGRITETGLSLGTPHYMSPEQATGDWDIDPRSDVYGLACVLYEMLAGQPPFHAPTAQAVLVRVLTASVAPIRMLRRTVPENVESAIQKALEKLPADRFESAAGFKAALADEGFVYKTKPIDTSMVSLAPVAPGTAVRPWKRDWRVLTSLGLAAVMTGVVGALWFRPEPTFTPTRLSIDLEGIDLTTPHRVIVSPDGSRFVMSGVSDEGRALYVRNADEVSFQRMPGTETGQYPDFSPAGDWIVYRENRTGSLQKVAVSGGAPRLVVAPGDLNPFYPNWGVEGSIVFVSNGTYIYRVADTGGEPELLYTHTGRLQNPRILPGGTKILVTDIDNQVTLVYDIEADAVDELLPGGIDARYVETGHLLYADLADGLWAVEFDVDSGQLTGEVTPVFSGLTTFLGRSARYSVSQTGTLAYSTGGGTQGALLPKQRLLVVGLDGETTEIPIAPRIYRNVRWSPDGSSIAFSGLGPNEDQGLSHIYVYDVDLRTAPRQLTFEATQGWPVWSPDGQRLVFNSSDGTARAGLGGGQTLGNTSDANLFIKSAFDDSEPELVLNITDTQYPYGWLEEDLIVFTDGSGGSSDLMIARLGDSASVSTYLNIEADLGAMRISPDGQRIAYGSSESGSFEIYVRSFPEARQQVIISEGGGDRPRWSPTGDAIYYWKVAPGPDTLMVAHVQQEPAFGVVSREIVLVVDYIPRTWDIHPDGDRFIIAQNETQAILGEDDGPVERFFVVVNWFEELKAALGEGR